MKVKHDFPELLQKGIQILLEFPWMINSQISFQRIGNPLRRTIFQAPQLLEKGDADLGNKSAWIDLQGPAE